MSDARPRTITCVVADDHPGLAQLLAHYLGEHGLTVVGIARDGEEALTLIERHHPIVAIVDLKMPQLNGIDVARRVTERGGETRTILYTGLGDRYELQRALDAGARGFVQKEAPLEDLLRAVELVVHGGIYIDPSLAGALIAPEGTEHPRTLTNRQREILSCFADGMTTIEVARALMISPDTVRVHVRNAIQTLHASTRTHAVATALRQSLIP